VSLSIGSNPQKVRLRQLTLNLYRNHPYLRLKLEDAHLVLSGNNGVGKTNILEAISLLSPGRGLRRAVYDDIIHIRANAENCETEELGRFAPPSETKTALAAMNAHPEFVVHAHLESALYGEVDIGTGSIRTPSGEAVRRVRINGASQPMDNLLEFCRIIWLTPAMDGLFTATPGERRRFLDRLVFAVEPSHGRNVSDYEKAMRARNKLLAQESYDTGWLDALERQIAAIGVAIAAARWHLVERLSALTYQENQGAFPSAIIEIVGFLENQLQQGHAALDIEEAFCDRLAHSRLNDRLSGRMLIGPHRSDLKIIHKEKSIPAALASTGEQKALLTGLILSHARLTALLCGFTPFLLLDEITAHLDEHRCGALFDLIDDMGVQAFLTGTERGLFHHMEGRGQFITLS